ncbi:hypothetical protein AAHE18_11G092500 [Arachis hypogaea]
MKRSFITWNTVLKQKIKVSGKSFRAHNNLQMIDQYMNVKCHFRTAELWFISVLLDLFSPQNAKSKSQKCHELIFFVLRIYQMEMFNILLENVRRSQVSPPAKPPLPRCSGSICRMQ